MPEFVMHRFLLHSLILIFAASGIACACPADVAATDAPSHDMHEAHGESPTPDCCDDCDEAVAIHGESLPVAIDIRFFADDFENSPALLPVVIDTDWSSAEAVDDAPAGTGNFLPRQTPVIRHDRMLD